AVPHRPAGLRDRRGASGVAGHEPRVGLTTAPPPCLPAAGSYGHDNAARLVTDLRTSDSSTLATSFPIRVLSSPPDRSATTRKVVPDRFCPTHSVNAIHTPPRPRPTSSISLGSS